MGTTTQTATQIVCPKCKRRQPAESYDRLGKPPEQPDRYATILVCQKCGFRFAPLDTATG